MSRVPLHVDWFGSLLDTAPEFLKSFGDLETKLLKYDIIDIKLDQPIFVTGMARSGTTILLEFLNSFDKTCSYHYGDYPLIHVNYFWNSLRKLIPGNSKKIERAHKDRIMINQSSPEALDEIVWMSFFKDLHNPETLNVLDAKTTNPEFELFFANALKKLLALRMARRIVLKNNYLITRLPYLLKTFPDAKFIIPIRKPEAHIASLMKQHRLLKKEQEKDPRGIRYMRRHGHFEFGVDFRPINTGKADEVMALWKDEETLKAYALYWSQLHEHLIKTLESDETVKSACCLVSYETLCEKPKATLSDIAAFCDLNEPEVIQHWSSEISSPDYYNPDFTSDESKAIKKLTDATYKKLQRLVG